MTDVNDLVAERIEAARRRIAADRERRANQKRNRDYGIAARHAAKLRHLAGISNATPAASGA